MAVSTNGVQRCLDRLRAMIMSGKLLPGQKLHQKELAEHLEVSRIPLREALSTLQAEGVVVHKPNTGFTVARFAVGDLAELYLMRRLLETELLRSVEMTEIDADALERIHEELAGISSADEPELYQQTNLRFHFTLFERSELRLVRQEVERLWYLSSFYRSLFMHDDESWARVHADHLRIIRAVRGQNVDELILASDEHRASTEESLARRFGRMRG